MSSQPNDVVNLIDLEVPAHWEERSVRRVLKSGGDQLLERSRSIVEAADELLKEEGLDGLTIRAVLKKTGLSRRAFYERFAGKDDLMLAVFEQTIRRAAGEYRAVIKQVEDPLERLRLIVVLIVLGRRTLDLESEETTDLRGAAMSREHMRLAESRPDDLEEALRPLIGLIAEQLADGMGKGVIREANSLRLATLLYNTVSTTVHTELLAQEIAEPDPEHRKLLASDIWEFCRRAISA